MSIRFSTVAVLGVSALLVTSCSEPAAVEETATEGAAGETTLTVYTSEPEEKVDEINAAFAEAHPEIKVEVYRAGTGDLNARIEAERASGAIEADVLWAADAPTFEELQQNGDLAKLSNVDSESLIEEAVDPDGYYVGTRIIPTVIAYNTEVLSQADAPASWQDLVGPQYKNKLVMPDPAISGAAAFNASVWKNADELGEDWISAVGANAPMIAASNGPTAEEIASGGHPVGVVVDYLVRELASAGSPIAAVYPTEGAPFITEPAGVFADSDAKDAAQTYINFLLSEQGQKIAVDQAYLPVREDVGTPEGAPSLGEIELLTPDLSIVTADKQAAVDLFQSAVQQ